MSFPYCTLNDVKKTLLGLDVSDIPSTLETAITDQYIPWAQDDIDGMSGYNLELTQTEMFLDGSGTATMLLPQHPIREVLSATLYVIPSAKWISFRRWFYINTRKRDGTLVAKRGGVEPNDDNVSPPYVFPPGLGFTNEDATVGNQTATFNDTETQYGKADLFIDCSIGKITIPPRILYQNAQGVPFWNYTWLSGQQNVRIEYVYGYSDPSQPDPLTGTSEGNLPLAVTEATAALAACYVLQSKGIFEAGGARSVSVDGVSKSYGELPYDALIKMLKERAAKLMQPYKRLSV